MKDRHRGIEHDLQLHIFISIKVLKMNLVSGVDVSIHSKVCI